MVEPALEGEMTAYLGYAKHVKGGSIAGNARNGKLSKTVILKAGPVHIDVSRDRAGTQIVAKRQWRRVAPSFR